ncbi:unnamed protein product [Parnassius apollo]|uniref:(apollo) hypothetical protein n=1 Tax=Parnassius apollo TaxID=110799 RepID=A0A8S3XUI8_PARAO|nr:unnamed protein product [Parnassius apollo]
MLQYMRYLLCTYHKISRAPAELRRAAHKQARMFRKVRPSRIVTNANELLRASAEWLDQNEVEGADDFTENHMDM